MHHLVPLVLEMEPSYCKVNPHKGQYMCSMKTMLLYKVDQKDSWQETSRPIAMQLASHNLEFKAIARHVYWAMHLVLPLQVDICRTSFVCMSRAVHLVVTGRFSDS